MWQFIAEDIYSGGKVKLGDCIRIRNCRSGMFLSVVEKDGQNILIAEKSSDNSTLFMLESVYD